MSEESIQARRAGPIDADRVLDSLGERWYLFWAWEEEDGRAWESDLTSDARAAQFLRSAGDQRSAAATLRRFLGATWVQGDLARADDAEVLAIAAARISSGHLRVEPWVAPRPDPRGVGTAPPADDRPPPVMAGTERTKLTWISIELVDEEGEPVPQESYELTLPDGSQRSGKLDGDGRAEERGISAGTCQVRFPQLDDEAWEFVETKSG